MWLNPPSLSAAVVPVAVVVEVASVVISAGAAEVAADTVEAVLPAGWRWPG